MNRVAADHVAQDLKQISQAWTTAERNGDSAFMEHTLTDDFMAIGPRGFVLNKEQWLQRFTSGSLKYDQLDMDELLVRTYGDAAVATCRTNQKVRYQQQVVASELRMMLVWVKQDGRWRLASAQMSPILGMP